MFTRALPDIYTRATSEPVGMTTVLEKFVSHGRNLCSRRITGTPFNSGSLRNYYCADAREWLVVEDFRRVRVIERQSWFGTHIDRIEPTDPEIHR